MEIRDLQINELPQLLSLYKHLHGSDHALPECNVIEATWKKIMNSEDYHCLGVWDGGQLLASCFLAILPNLTRGCRPYALIENVVTHESHRRRGYGKNLLQAAQKVAWDLNCYKVMLMTGRLNEGIFKFYDAAGFNRFSKQAFIAKPEAQ